MTFPETRPTLIQRIASDSDEGAWREFFEDYWRPVCGFAARTAGLRPDEAEDVAAAVFVVLFSNRLLVQWNDQPAAKLRSLICSVTRKVVSNRARVLSGRQKSERARRDVICDLSFVTFDGRDRASEDDDPLIRDWFSQLLRQVTDELISELAADGNADCIRVLYGRICDGMTVRAVAEALDLSPSTVDSHFSHARKKLEQKLRSAVEASVRRYCGPDKWKDEFEGEWRSLSAYLDSIGGVEAALRDPSHWSSLPADNQQQTAGFSLVTEAVAVRSENS